MVALGLILLVPLRRTAGRRRLAFEALVTLAGIAVATGTLAALLISEYMPLFGFMEQGYRLEIVIAIAAEVVALMSLVARDMICPVEMRSWYPTSSACTWL